MSMLSLLKYRMMLRSRKSKLSFFMERVCGGRWPAMLDVGVADREYSPFDNFLEKNCPHPERLAVLSIRSLDEFRKRYPLIRAVVYNGGKFPFEDNAFEVVHCNAVLEHVGDAEEQVAFVREIARVGRRFFLTTPSRRFPIEMHTNLPMVHYLPKSAQDRILRLLGKGWATGDYMYLLSKRELDAIVRNAGVRDYQIITRRLLGMPLHYFVIGGLGLAALDR